MKSQPHERTNIVLVDALDDANGSATPLPYNLITLYITQPFGESIFGASNYNWLSGKSEYQFETPRFSPDGQKIAVGIRQPDGYKDIWILDSQGNKLEELMHDRTIDGGAVWSADAPVFIYFSSDRSGIFNLYVYDLASKQISQVSNVLGGAFMPTITPDGARLRLRITVHAVLTSTFLKIILPHGKRRAATAILIR